MWEDLFLQSKWVDASLVSVKMKFTEVSPVLYLVKLAVKVQTSIYSEFGASQSVQGFFLKMEISLISIIKKPLQQVYISVYFCRQITQDQVTVFAADLTQLQDKFIECGPSSVGNDLDQGDLPSHNSINS